MLLPVHGIIDPVPNYCFYQILSDQREPGTVQNNIPLTYLWVLAVDCECTANCSVSHRVLDVLRSVVTVKEGKA